MWDLWNTAYVKYETINRKNYIKVYQKYLFSVDCRNDFIKRKYPALQEGEYSRGLVTKSILQCKDNI